MINIAKYLTSLDPRTKIAFEVTNGLRSWASSKVEVLFDSVLRNYFRPTKEEVCYSKLYKLHFESDLGAGAFLRNKLADFSGGGVLGLFGVRTPLNAWGDKFANWLRPTTFDIREPEPRPEGTLKTVIWQDYSTLLRIPLPRSRTDQEVFEYTISYWKALQSLFYDAVKEGIEVPTEMDEEETITKYLNWKKKVFDFPIKYFIHLLIGISTGHLRNKTDFTYTDDGILVWNDSLKNESSITGCVFSSPVAEFWDKVQAEIEAEKEILPPMEEGEKYNLGLTYGTAFLKPSDSVFQTMKKQSYGFQSEADESLSLQELNPEAVAASLACLESALKVTWEAWFKSNNPILLETFKRLLIKFKTFSLLVFGSNELEVDKIQSLPVYLAIIEKMKRQPVKLLRRDYPTFIEFVNSLVSDPFFQKNECYAFRKLAGQSIDFKGAGPSMKGINNEEMEEAVITKIKEEYDKTVKKIETELYDAQKKINKLNKIVFKTDKEKSSILEEGVKIYELEGALSKTLKEKYNTLEMMQKKKTGKRMLCEMDDYYNCNQVSNSELAMKISDMITSDLKKKGISSSVIDIKKIVNLIEESENEARCTMKGVRSDEASVFKAVDSKGNSVEDGYTDMLLKHLMSIKAVSEKPDATLSEIEQVVEDFFPKRKIKYKQMLYGLLFPERAKEVFLADDSIFPTFPIKLTSNFIITTSSSTSGGTFLLQINPQMLLDSSSNLSNVIYCNDDTLDGVTSITTNGNPSISVVKVEKNKIQVPGLFNSYRVSAFSVIVQFIGRVDRISGIIGGGMTFSSTPSSSFDDTYTVFQYIDDSMFSETTTPENGLKMVYFPKDTGDYEFLQTNTDPILTGGLNTNTRFLIYGTGLPENSPCIRVDMYAHAEIIPAPNVSDILKTDSARMSTGLNAKEASKLIHNANLVTTKFTDTSAVEDFFNLPENLQKNVIEVSQKSKASVPSIIKEHAVDTALSIIKS